MARPVQTGIRNVKLIIKDASSPTKTRQLLCHAITIPEPARPEFIKVKPEHELVSVIAGADVESALGFSVGVDQFIDATQPTVSEILAGTGLGSGWTPINDAMTVPVASNFRCFTFEFHLDARAQGGAYTIRTVQGYVAPAVSYDRADPMVLQYSGEVFGSITDTVGP